MINKIKDSLGLSILFYIFWKIMPYSGVTIDPDDKMSRNYIKFSTLAQMLKPHRFIDTELALWSNGHNRCFT
jgi:hypothetical protein